LELLGTIAELADRQVSVLREMVTDRWFKQEQLINSLGQLSPMHMINNYRQRLDEALNRLDRTTHNKLEKKHLQLENYRQSLRSLNPRSVLGRGYAIVTRQKDGMLIKSAEQVQPDEQIHIQVSIGNMEAQVIKTNTGGS